MLSVGVDNPLAELDTLSVQILLAPNVAHPAVPIIASPKLPTDGERVLLKGYSAINVCPTTPKVEVKKTKQTANVLKKAFDFFIRVCENKVDSETEGCSKT